MDHDETSLRALCKRCEVHRFERRRPLKDVGVLNEQKEIVCKLHRSEPLDVYCGNQSCRKQLSLRAAIDERGVVAIVGDTGSGKSTFLYILRRALRAGRNAPVQIKYTVGDSDEQLEKTVKIDRSGMMMGALRADATQHNYAWELVPSSSTAEERWIVAFHDAAGSAWRNLQEINVRDRPVFLRYVNLIGGALLVIDGKRLPTHETEGTYEDAVQEAIQNELAITAALKQRVLKRSHVRTAIVVSKSDLLWDQPGCGVFRQDSGASRVEIAFEARKLLDRSGRGPLLNELATLPGAVEFFAVSALGEGAAGGNIDNAKPERLVEPVLYAIGIDGARLQM
jgi:energy-coupling factor transporter ATP-binding protein EcfA2